MLLGDSSSNDIQLDLNLSSSDEEIDASLIGTGSGSISTERIPSPAPSTHTTGSTSTASTAIIGSNAALHQHQVGCVFYQKILSVDYVGFWVFFVFAGLKSRRR